MTRITILVGLLVLLPSALPADAERGLVVHVGTSDGTLEAEYASRDPLVVLGVALDAKSGERARQHLASKNLLGRATILDHLDSTRVPVVSNTAILVLADLDRLGKQAPSEKELLRVVRPLGTLKLKRQNEWRTLTKPWPKEYDSWPMYFHDAAGSDVCKDTAVGPVHGLQWHTGDADSENKIGLRSTNGVLVSAEEAPRTGGRKSPPRLVARDAFSGIKLWERNDLTITNRYSFLLDNERVYLHADKTKHLSALDLMTGKNVRVYDQGIDFSDMKYGNFNQMNRLWPEAVVAGDLLVQVGEHRIVVLDSKTGERRWQQDLGKGHAHLPTVVDDLLIVVQGAESVRSPAYLPGWNCCRLDEIVAYELKTGKERWRWKNDMNESVPFVLHMAAAERTLALVAGTKEKPGGTYLLTLDPLNGKLHWRKPATEIRKEGFGGHGSNVRVLVQKGRVWCTGLRNAVSYAVKDGGDPVKVTYMDSQCQPTRGTPYYHFSALCALRLDDNKVFRSEASRPACDIGAFPSNGLLYTTATNCGCHPFMSGFNAFHSESSPVSYSGERLQSGDAKPAPAKEVSEDAWPMYMRDAQRSNWTDAAISTDLKVQWKVSIPDPANGLSTARAADWRRNALNAGWITAPTSAEGLVLIAVPDAHQVLALDTASGKEKWRITAAGRVDSPPTIHRGLVLFGTRDGWVYAVNRDDGKLIWRFLAAPAQRQLIASGQPEALWPVFGTVVLHDNLAWVTAGRSTQLDGGIFWYALNPTSGKVVKSGVLHAKEDWKESTAKGMSYGKLTMEAPPDTASPFAVTADGKQMLMARSGLDVKTGAMLRAGLDFWFVTPNNEAHFAGAPVTFGDKLVLPSCVLPRRFGLLTNGNETASLYPVSYYAGTLAKIFAYKGGDFVGLLMSGVPSTNRGGGPDGLKRCRTEAIGKKPSGRDDFCKLVWQSKDFPKQGKDDYAQHQALVKAGDYLLVGSGKQMTFYRHDNGEKAASFDLPAVPVHNGIAVAKGNVIVCCQDGSVICLGK